MPVNLESLNLWSSDQSNTRKILIDLPYSTPIVAQNTFLQFTGFNCLLKSEGFKPDGAQLFALIILGALASVSILGTLVHALNLKAMAKLWQSERDAERQLAAHNVKVAPNDNELQFEGELDMNNGSFGSGKQQAAVSLLTGKQKQQQVHAAGQQIVIDQHEQPDSDDEQDNHEIDNSHPLKRPRSFLMSLINVLINFSLIKNGNKLFDTSTSKKQGNVGLIELPHEQRQRKLREREQERNLIRRNKRQQKPGTQTVGVIDLNGNKLGEVELQMEMLDAASGCSSTQATSSGSSGSRQSQRSINNSMGQASDISCVHGLRFWTISWIIFAHTMQYTEWAAFARAYQVENNITMAMLQPLMNATFSVDTFFLVSGLLTTYVTWSISGGSYKRFNKFAFLISRYLRLTPQVLIVILLFIVFPLMGDGPYWRGLIQKNSDYCRENWWVNALYLQSFIKEDKIVSSTQANSPCLAKFYYHSITLINN